MKTQHGRDLSGDEFGEMFEEFANSADKINTERFLEYITKNAHRTLQQRIMAMVVELIERWSKSQYDVRNEATVLLCKKIVAATGDRYDRYLPFI